MSIALRMSTKKWAGTLHVLPIWFGNETAYCVNLAPAALYHHISVTPMLPAGSNPHRMRTRRRFPSASLPCIGISIPTVVSAYPDMLTAWPRAAMLNKEPRRCDLYHHFCCLDDAGSNRNGE